MFVSHLLETTEDHRGRMPFTCMCLDCHALIKSKFVQEELRREHADRVSAQALVEQHQQQLADLKLEASGLRQASAEHARSAYIQIQFSNFEAERA